MSCPVRTFPAVLTAALLLAPFAAAGGPEFATLRDAVAVVREFGRVPETGIPPAMLRDATGVAVFPDLVKAGLLVGGRFGRGVVLPRRADGTWGDPVFVNLAGGGFGLQAGVQAADVILVFKTARSLDRLLNGRGKMTLGGDAGVAAGPVGRQAEAATDARLRAEVYSYSRSRGLFAGVSLQGAGVWPDASANRAFAIPTPEERATADSLKAWLTSLAPPPRAVVVPAPPAGVGVPRPVDALPGQTAPPPLAPSR